MAEIISSFKLEVFKILEKMNENIEIWKSSITDDSIIFAINNNFSPDVYVGGLLF